MKKNYMIIISRKALAQITQPVNFHHNINGYIAGHLR